MTADIVGPLGLPNIQTIAEFQAWRADAAQCLPAALDIARDHGLPVADPHLFTTGTDLVVGLGRDLILKIFPPMLRGQFLSERASLGLLQGRLNIRIPEIVDEGERDGWRYLVITRLPGVLGTEAWPALPEDAKERVLGQIGETIAEVQKVPVGELSAIEPRWDQFMRQQIAGCRARHARLGLPAKYLDGLDELLGEAATLIPIDAPPVILTGEYIPENFLLSQDSGGWRLAAVGADRLRRRDDGMGRIRPARPERLHDRGHAASCAISVAGLRIFQGRYDAGADAAADGADAAAPRQRSNPAHLHRGLAAEGGRPRRTGAVAVADLTERRCVFQLK